MWKFKISTEVSHEMCVFERDSEREMRCFSSKTAAQKREQQALEGITGHLTSHVLCCPAGSSYSWGILYTRFDLRTVVSGGGGEQKESQHADGD